MKEQICLPNVKYLRLSTEHFMGISIFVYIHMCRSLLAYLFRIHSEPLTAESE